MAILVGPDPDEKMTGGVGRAHGLSEPAPYSLRNLFRRTRVDRVREHLELKQENGRPERDLQL